MKNLFLLLLLSVSIKALASPLTDSAQVSLTQARHMADPKNAKYDPKQAFAIYSRMANQGNPEAMNGLGMLYSNGIGVAENDPEAIRWFGKAANGGYNRAYFNLGTLYKTARGPGLDLVKAYQYFKTGADLNDPMCLYGQGYMLYKGLGCTQNYKQAAQLFRHGARLNDEGSYFMLGLCFRNGYGVTASADSGQYWLKRAALKGDQRAIAELATGTPENANITNVSNLQATNVAGSPPVDLSTGFKQIAHHLPANNIGGQYNGYLIKFDWSGKFIISQSALSVDLVQKDRSLTGTWKENGQSSVSLSGNLADSAVVFSNTAYNETDHYRTLADPLPVMFKDSHLNMVQNKDTVFLTGTLRSFSPQTQEPQKPLFLMLIRTSAQQTNTDNALINASKADTINFIPYPNPFTRSLQLRYTLKAPANVSIIVAGLANGIIVYRIDPGLLAAGDHTTPISFNGAPGSYIVTLQYGNKARSAIILKL